MYSSLTVPKPCLPPTPPTMFPRNKPTPAPAQPGSTAPPPRTKTINALNHGRRTWRTPSRSTSQPRRPSISSWLWRIMCNTMERTRECGLIWWREGMHGWAIRAVGKLVRGRWWGRYFYDGSSGLWWELTNELAGTCLAADDIFSGWHTQTTPTHTPTLVSWIIKYEKRSLGQRFTLYSYLISSFRIPETYYIS